MLSRSWRADLKGEARQGLGGNGVRADSGGKFEGAQANRPRSNRTGAKSETPRPIQERGNCPRPNRLAAVLVAALVLFRIRRPGQPKGYQSGELLSFPVWAKGGLHFIGLGFYLPAVSASVEVAKPPRVESRRAKWARIRARYESGDLSLRELAEATGESESTMMKRSMRERWVQKKRIVRAAVRELEAGEASAMLEHAKDKLAPLIEREKERIVTRSFKIGNRGLSRIEKLWKDKQPTDAKAEADAGRATETFVRILRTAAGMDEVKAAGGGINLNLLCNQALIQTAPAPGSQG